MKKIIILLLFVPVLLFAVVAGIVAKRALRAPSAFELKKFPMPAIGETPQTDDQKIKDGWKVFTEKGCVYCHGVGGQGGVKNPGAVGGEVPSLIKVAEGYTAEELKERIRKGVKSEEIATEPGAPSPPPLYMPSWKDALSEKELDDVVHYLLSLAPKKEDSWE